MPHIKKIKIHNYKRFSDFDVSFDPELSVLIGDNEAGKSSILNAIDLVLSGSRHKLESVGLDSIFNIACICLLYTSPSPRDRQKSRMPSSA